MNSSPILECRNLYFSYNNKKILSDINLELYAGEFVAVLGRNGAGKSTLLSCLSGLVKSEYDKLDIEGLEIKSTSRLNIARRLSFVPQEQHEMFPFSVEDVVVMGRTVFLGPFGAPSDEDYTIVYEVLKELNIEKLVDRIYTTLSGGEKQLVLLARALVQTRTLIFLDEPTNHLDYNNRYHMLLTLKGLAKEKNSCVVACLHDPNHALLFADRVILLDQGTVLVAGKTEEVLTSSMVSRLYEMATYKEIGSNTENFTPAFAYKKLQPKVLLLVGASGDGKTTLLQKTIEAHQDTSFAGVICPGTWKNNRRYSSTAHCLRTEETTLFCKRSQEDGDGPFIFYEEAEKLMERSLAVDGCSRSDCVIIDEVGPLELKGRGYAKHLAPLLSLQHSTHIWAVRPSIVDSVCRKWMLVDPVIVYASDPEALVKIDNFLLAKREVCDV